MLINLLERPRPQVDIIMNNITKVEVHNNAMDAVPLLLDACDFWRCAR